MSNSNEVERKIHEMLLDLGDEQLLSVLEESLRNSDESHKRIDDALKDMMDEVDRLLLKMDELEELENEMPGEENDLIW